MNTPYSHAPGPEDSNRPTLYELYGSLNGRSSATDRRNIVQSIMLHPEFEAKQRNACRAVLRRWDHQPDLMAELMQQTSCRLVQFLLKPSPKYHDDGADRFGGWIWRVIFRATRRAWRECRPLWLKRKSLPPLPPFKRLSSWTETTNDWEDMLIAISQMHDPLTRSIMNEWVHGFTIKESAQLHGLSYSRVRTRRRKGKTELRQLWFGP